MMQLYHGNRGGVLASAQQESGFAWFAPLWAGAKWLVSNIAIGVASYGVWDAITGDNEEEKANTLAEQVDANTTTSEKELMAQKLNEKARNYYANISGFLTGYGPRARACGVNSAIQSNIDNAISEFKTLLIKGDATTYADLYAMRGALQLFLERHCKDPAAEKAGMLPCNPATGFPGDPGWIKQNPGGCTGVPGTPPTVPGAPTVPGTPPQQAKTPTLANLTPILILAGLGLAAYLFLGRKG